jgi:RHS repeat-associated protein
LEGRHSGDRKRDGKNAIPPRLETTSSNPITSYLQENALGSTVRILDAQNGNGILRVRYDVFGKASFASEGTPNNYSYYKSVFLRFLYTGREMLVDPNGGIGAGLYDYRNRIYSPTLGRFSQPDPIGFDAGDVNWYRYVGNNAVNWRDPLGFMASRPKWTEEPGSAKLNGEWKETKRKYKHYSQMYISLIYGATVTWEAKVEVTCVCLGATKKASGKKTVTKTIDFEHPSTGGNPTAGPYGIGKPSTNPGEIPAEVLDDLINDAFQPIPDDKNGVDAEINEHKPKSADEGSWKDGSPCGKL